MNNFLDFIKKDTDAKKTLISTMPTRTDTNKKKLNSTIELIEKKYQEYAKLVRNYMNAKKNSIKPTDEKKDIEHLKSRVTNLEYIKFLLNPTNSYFEKMGFDSLLYEINNYYIFNFHSLNDIINGFLDKFEVAGIFLTSDDFNYTCYVHEYMSSFLEVRRSRSDSYTKVSEIFETIYWSNPELIEHIELNFRKLIRENAKKFTTYINNKQKEVMDKNGIKSYSHCLEQLQDAYIDINLASTESIYDIIELAKNGSIDMEQYLVGNKVREAAYSSLIPEKVDNSNQKEMDKICATLEKLKNNIEEFTSYLEFSAFFNDFKNQYSELVKADTKKTDNKALANVLGEITKKEEELNKINKKIFNSKPGLFEFKTDAELKKLRTESVIKAKELYSLYKNYDIEYFKDKVLHILDYSMTVSDLLEFYYSFDYFKKLAIQKIYNVTDYDEIRRYSKNFDLFALNPKNIITTGVVIFEETNIPRIIANKYRLNNINIEEKDLSKENLKVLLNKIMLILRSNKINASSITAEQLWFIVKTEQLLNENS